MVTQNDHVTFTSPSAGARQQALDQTTPLPAWTSEHNLELNGSWEELLETRGWGGLQENKEANDAPVSNGLYQPRLRAQRNARLTQSPVSDRV
jgi:hypothetical protein